MAMYIGLIQQKWEASPTLVVVPNSTITNWMREFARWAPNLSVVPFYGDAASREIMAKYEVFKDDQPRKTPDIKFHVLVTTYETVTGNTGALFRKIPRWEVLVVDEGQRRRCLRLAKGINCSQSSAVKSDASLIFKTLKQLNTAQRIIMTGVSLS
jgi:chromodomain-helicase-DNA-binding protein 4